MEGFRPEDSFRGDVARRYDDELRGDEDETVLFLKEIAAGRDCLEFAVGTGRIALPLAAAGLRVDGIELSPDMIEELRAKPGGSKIGVVNGDMTAVEMGRRYGVVYLVFNSIGNVITQDGQVKCFENAARHLDEDGVFLLECRFPRRQSKPTTASSKSTMLELRRFTSRCAGMIQSAKCSTCHISILPMTQSAWFRSG